MPLQVQQAQGALQLQGLQTQEAQRTLERNQAMDQAFTGGAYTIAPDGTATINRKVLYDHLNAANAGSLIPQIETQLTGLDEKRATTQKAIADAQKAQGETQAASADYLGSIGATIKASNYDPVVAASALGHAASLGGPYAQQAQQMYDHLKQNPQNIQQMTDEMIAASPKQVEAAKNVAQTREAESKTAETEMLLKMGGTPAMQDVKYQNLKQQEAMGQPLGDNPQEIAANKAFEKAYEQRKLLVPTSVAKINFNLQNAGLTGTGGQPSAIAQSIANGSMKWQDVVSARTPMSVKSQLLSEVKSINPAFNSGDFEVEQGVKKMATSGAVGQQLLAIGTAREHMKTFSQLADALDNNNLQVANRIGNEFGVQFGSDKVTNFQIASQAFGGEVGRALDGAGVTQAERAEAASHYSTNMSPQQFRGATKTIDALLAGKQKAAHDWFDQGIKAQPAFGQPGTTGNRQVDLTK